MKWLQNSRPLMRTTIVIGVLVTLVSGVTYAALQSQDVRLTGNTIQSATARLLIGTTPGSLGASSAGFSFSNVEPGGDPAPAGGNTFYLQNTGTTNLALRMSIDQFDNPNSVVLSKVFVIVRPADGQGAAQTIPMTALMDSYDTGGTDLNLSLASGQTGQYQLQISMAADAISGGPSSGATISNIQFVFDGVSAPDHA